VAQIRPFLRSDGRSDPAIAPRLRTSSIRTRSLPWSRTSPSSSVMFITNCSGMAGHLTPLLLKQICSWKCGFAKPEQATFTPSLVLRGSIPVDGTFQYSCRLEGITSPIRSSRPAVDHRHLFQTRHSWSIPQCIQYRNGRYSDLT